MRNYGTFGISPHSPSTRFQPPPNLHPPNEEKEDPFGQVEGATADGHNEIASVFSEGLSLFEFLRLAHAQPRLRPWHVLMFAIACNSLESADGEPRVYLVLSPESEGEPYTRYVFSGIALS